jgi:hypothetical protein
MRGAAINTNTMCCAMRAEKSATDNAHNGDMKAAAATTQPASANLAAAFPASAPRPRHHCHPAKAANTTITRGSRLNRVNNSPGSGAEPQ